MTVYPIPIAPLKEASAAHPPGTPLFGGTKHLCAFAERLVSELRPSWPTAQIYHGLPWITPVLGTGCLDLGDVPVVEEDAEEAVKAAARRWAGPGTEFGAFGAPGDEAWKFLIALRDDRCMATDTTPGTAAPRVEDRAAGWLVLASMLTWLYHQFGASSMTPMSRWSAADVVALDAEDDLRTEGLRRKDVDALKALLRKMERELARGAAGPWPGADTSSVTGLLRRVREGLEDHRIALQDVRLMTALAWLEVLGGSAFYPGWSDLLFGLSLTSGRDSPSGVRPTVDSLHNLEEQAKDLLAATTKESWTARVAGAGSARRRRLYDAVAALLEEQAAICGRFYRSYRPSDDPEQDDANRIAAGATLAIKNAVVAETKRVTSQIPGAPDPAMGDVGPPHPVCFVTSFDIEVEMALWARGNPFRVVLPALVLTNLPQVAELVWLVADIDPAGAPAAVDGLERLCDGPHEWHLARTLFDTTDRDEDVPIVVRLCGAPLLELPPIDAGLAGELKGVQILGGQQFMHALTIDEYSSMLFSGNEWFFAGRAANKSELPSRALPAALTRSTSSNSRVWLALGVQLEDPTIRSRAFSQLSASALQHRSLDPAPNDESSDAGAGATEMRQVSLAPDVLGLAVNRRIDHDQATALRWLGFEPVLDLDCGEFAPEVEHWVDHLRVVRRVLDELADHVDALTEAQREWVAHRGQESAGRGPDILEIAGVGPFRWRRSDTSYCGLWSELRRNPT